MNYASDQSWVAIVIIAALLISTAGIWLRFRSASRMRPWLIRHVVGNSILAVGLFLIWVFNLGFFYYALVAAGVLGMWIWGNSKLRAAAQNNK
jgi:hypothetical protein